MPRAECRSPFHVLIPRYASKARFSCTWRQYLHYCSVLAMSVALKLLRFRAYSLAFTRLSILSFLQRSTLMCVLVASSCCLSFKLVSSQSVLLFVFSFFPIWTACCLSATSDSQSDSAFGAVSFLTHWVHQRGSKCFSWQRFFRFLVLLCCETETSICVARSKGRFLAGRWPSAPFLLSSLRNLHVHSCPFLIFTNQLVLNPSKGAPEVKVSQMEASKD